jgi:hypothetical protein
MVRVMVLCAILMSAALAGCVAVGGTSNERRPTAGQELIDLKSALDAGAITQAEFDQKKAEILRKQ